MRAEDDDALGLVLRYVDNDNYYRLSSDTEGGFRRLIKRVAGTVSVLWEDTNPHDVGAEFELTLEAIGSRLKGHQDGTLLFTVDDDTLPNGRIGVYTWRNRDVRFESVSVVRPTVETTLLFEDEFAAGSSAAFSVIDVGTTDAPSSWAIDAGAFRQTSNIFSGPTGGADPEKEGTYAVAGDPAWNDIVLRVALSSGDDDAIGVMIRYVDDNNYYRFSMDREGSYRRLVSKKAGVFRVLWEDNFQFELGRMYGLVLATRGTEIEGYIDEIPIFRVVDSDHTSGRIALYSWGNTDARFASVQVYPDVVLGREFTLRDEFEVLVGGAYRIDDEGTVDGPAVWEALDGELRQTASIRGDDPTSQPGSNAITSQFSGTDYLVTATMHSTGGGMGLVFRANDSGYYRFAIDRDQGIRYLLKKVGATFTVLYTEPFTFAPNVEYTLAVVAAENSLTGYINGVRVFSVSDDSHAAGGAGLYVSNNPNAAFTRFDVLEPAWLAYYRFGQERALPAGTRLRIFSGRASEPFAAQPLEEARHVASEFERGELAFGAGKAELRVVEGGAPAHQREFASDDSFVATPVRVLRRADGTGYAIVPEAGGAFTEGDYRFHFEYQRTTVAQTLSERGQTGPESVSIDVPWKARNG